MRRSFALVFLFGIGCRTASNPDTVAAREFVRSLYPSADTVLVEEPKYAAIPKIPKKASGARPRTGPRSAGSGSGPATGMGAAPRATTGWSG